MNIDTTKENVCVNQLIEQKNENRIAEEDVIVPDIKPDVLNIIKTSGTICIYKKEVLDGKVKIDGTLQVYLIYSADDETNSIRSLSTNLDFSEIIQISNTMEDINVILKPRIISVDAKILNGRKINIKGNLSFGLKVYSNEEISIIREIQGIDNLQKQSSEIEVNSLIGSGTTKAFAKETIRINQSDNLAEILDTEINIKNRDIKISYNKVLAKADTYVKVLYLTDDNRICSCESNIATMGFVDMKDITDDNFCETFYELKNVIIKPGNEDEHSIYVEMEFEISCFAFEKKSISIIEDIYSPNCDVQYLPKNINIIEHKANNINVYTIRENIIDPELENSKICNIKIKPLIFSQKVSDNHINFEGEVQLSLLYYIENDNVLKVKELTIPLNFLANIPEIDEKTQVDTELEIRGCYITVSQDGSVDINAEIAFLVNSCSLKQITVIDDIKVNDEKCNSNYSIIIYYTKQGDTLWKVAKKYGSTIQEILAINKIENPNVIQVGTQLYIPRYNSRKTA